MTRKDGLMPDEPSKRPRRRRRDPLTGESRNPAIREIESRACRQCGAEPGRRCVTSDGGILNHPHAARRDAAIEAAPPATRPAVESYCARRRQLNVSEAAVAGRIRTRQRVFAHYGTHCACCGETEDLTIDHVNGGGAAHREEVGNRGGLPFFKWLIRNGFPAGFQTLCSPCNLNKGEGPRCYLPHGQLQECLTCHRPIEETVAVAARRRRRITLRLVAAELGELRAEVERLAAQLAADGPPGPRPR